MRSMDDPEHEAKLRDIAVSANLTDLINTDEYLSDKDPEEVIDAYNELMEIAPEIHNKKPLLRAALRQYMESGGIDVQSLGLIGDIGRKTESRADDTKKMLAENVNKMLESEERARADRAKQLWDEQREKMRSELTVSEGRKDRMARAEEARKQRASQRQIAEARSDYEKFKALLQHQDSVASLKAKRDLALAGEKADILIQKSKDINRLIDDSLDLSNRYSIPNLNDTFKDSRAFNALDDKYRSKYVNAYKNYGYDPNDIFTSNNKLRRGVTDAVSMDNAVTAFKNRVSSPSMSSIRNYYDIDIDEVDSEE